jgi:hypothetical protein
MGSSTKASSLKFKLILYTLSLNVSKIIIWGSYIEVTPNICLNNRLRLIVMEWDCLRPAATSGPIVYPPGDVWAWRAMVAMMPTVGNSWLVHQSSLAVLPSETSETSRRNWWRSENFASQYLKYLKGSLTRCKILRHGTSGFTSHQKEGVLRIFIALKNPSPRPGLNPRPLGPVSSTLTTTPPTRLCER